MSGGTTTNLSTLTGATTIVSNPTPLSSLVAGSDTKVSAVDLRREGARQVVAIMIVGAALTIVVFSFFSLWTTKHRTFADLKTLLDVLVAPIIGIVGAVTGFYFGASGVANPKS